MKIVLRYMPRTITGWLTPKRFLKCDAAELCLWGIKLEEVTIIGMRCAVCSLDEWLRSWKMALLILLHRSTLLFPFRFTEKHGIMVSGPTSFKYSIANSSYMTYAQENKVLLLFRLMYGNPGQSWILDSTPRIPNSWYWIPVLSVEFGYWIPIVNGYLESLSCSPDYKAPDSDSISKIYPDSGIRPYSFTWGELFIANWAIPLSPAGKTVWNLGYLCKFLVGLSKNSFLNEFVLLHFRPVLEFG